MRSSAITGDTRFATRVDQHPDSGSLASEAPRVVSSGSRIPWQAALCAVTYLVLAFSVFGLFTPLDAGQMSGIHTPDQAQQVWFLEWARFALFHGMNPFYSPLMNQPVGINLASNTSMLGLATIVSPMTALLGAVETWNLLLRLALFVSATSMCLVLRRWVAWWPAAFFGGLIYGFSSYELFWANGYLFFAFVPLPPVIFLLLYELLERQRWRPRRTGALLGAALGIQYLISAEIMATTVLMMALATLLYALVVRRTLSQKWAYLRSALVPTIVTVGVLVGYPVVFAYLGPASIHGFAHVQGGQGDLLGPFVPGSRLLLNTGSSVWKNPTKYFYTAPMYLGVPLLAAVLATVIWLRRRRTVLFAGVMSGAALVLSLGAGLDVDGNSTGIPLPFAPIAHLPIAGNIVAARLALFTVLFAAAVLAMGLDELHRRTKRSGDARASRTNRSKVLSVGGSGVVIALIVLTLLPGRIPTTPTPITRFFASPTVKAIPAGSVLLTYPYPGAIAPDVSGEPIAHSLTDLSVADALLDQVVSGMRFHLIGGYGWMPPQSESGLPNPTPLPPISVQRAFDFAFYHFKAPLPTLSSSQESSDLRLFLRRYGVGTVVVLPVGADPQAVTAEVTAAIGPPVRSGGTTLWFHVQDRLDGRG